MLYFEGQKVSVIDIKKLVSFALASCFLKELREERIPLRAELGSYLGTIN